ncbi:MAG: hypothetical protein LQ350_005266 [Teloschistes chrysophthalmus]|nr:MAG: hypothetical protein LQ350_005266 [Niorma chrysophthalma]
MGQVDTTNHCEAPIVSRDTQLSFLQTSFIGRPLQKSQRPLRTETQSGTLHYHEQHIPEEPKIKRQASKGRLLGIFGRTKSSREAKKAAEQGTYANINPVDKPGEKVSPPRDELYNQEATTTKSTTLGEAIGPKSSKTTRSKSFKKAPSSNKSVPWDPPPLFQAYPQSVKYATLSAPSVSSDSILQFQNDKKRKAKRKKSRSGSDKKGGSSGEEKEEEEEEEVLEDNAEDNLQLDDWSQKIYLLVTSGYMLQYAGEGSFDRLPEKIMPIGKESAAFASDAIPGKHWVLQVSHVLDENGFAKTGSSWSFLRPFGLVGNMNRCSASNFLLVLDSPEELGAWLNVVRREIEAWGGPKYQASTTDQPNTRDLARPLQQKPSRRYLVKRDPHQFANNADSLKNVIDDKIDPMPTIPPRKSSTTTQDSVHSPSISNATASTDQYMLDQLGHSPQVSYISASANTHATSVESSPVFAPSKPVSSMENSNGGSNDVQVAVPSTLAPRDVSPPHYSSPEPSRSQSSTLTHPTSTVQGSLVQTSSHGAPNFSVPSFSKRYSSAHSTPPLSTASSSSANNLPRKSASPATINEQYDDYDDIAAAVEDSLNLEYSDQEAASACHSDTYASVVHERPKLADSNSLLRAPSSDRLVPRRLSSLEYSRGISPVNLQCNMNNAPHPPPTSALPALPESRHKLHSAPVRTLRRPVSMVVPTGAAITSSSPDAEHLPHIDASPKVEDPQTFLTPPSRPAPPPPLSETLPGHGLLPPSKEMNRRSMPHLNHPPSDPPDYPLPTPPVPPLPLIKLSSGSLRKSVERPLRAGLGPRARGLVEGVEV